MAVAAVALDATCPREGVSRLMIAVDAAGGTHYRCSGCEWLFTSSDQITFTTTQPAAEEVPAASPWPAAQPGTF